MSPRGAPARPVFLVVEDGHEYVDRFTRFLGAAMTFIRAGSFDEALRLLHPGAADGAGTAAPAPAPEAEPRSAPAAAPDAAIAGLLLDLDFRRTPAAALLGEGDLALRARTQGILILRALRARGVTLPALLFADLDDAEAVAFLESTAAPLQVVPSSEGLPQIAERLRRLAAPRG